MFFNNFINNIIKSMMAVCAVANGWSSGDVLTENPFRGNKSVVLAGSNSGDAKRSWADVVKGGQQGESPKMVNTTTFSSKGSNKCDGRYPEKQNRAESLKHNYHGTSNNANTFNSHVPNMQYICKQDIDSLLKKNGINGRESPEEICNELLSKRVNEIPETLLCYLSRIKHISDENFAKYLAYPLMKHLNVWKDRKELQEIKKRIRKTARNLDVIEDEVKEDDCQISLMALCEYAEM